MSNHEVGHVLIRALGKLEKLGVYDSVGMEIYRKIAI